MAVFIILIVVGSCRNIFNPNISKLAFGISTLITLTAISLIVFIISIISADFRRVGSQFSNLFSTYDSFMLIVNASIFCLSISFFIELVGKEMLRSSKSLMKRSN